MGQSVSTCMKSAYADDAIMVPLQGENVNIPEDIMNNEAVIAAIQKHGQEISRGLRDLTVIVNTGFVVVGAGLCVIGLALFRGLSRPPPPPSSTLLGSGLHLRVQRNPDGTYTESWESVYPGKVIHEAGNLKPPSSS